MPSPATKLYIDLTDVFVHAIWHTTCGGIPRVQLEVAAALVHTDPDAVPFSLHKGQWRNLRALFEAADHDTDKLFADLHASFAYLREYPRWRDPRHILMLVRGHVGGFVGRLRSRMPQLNPGDTLFVGGAFWMNRNIIELSAGASTRGVHLIVLFHDLIPLMHPQYAGHDFTEQYEAMLRLPAHFIVTTSFNARDLEAARARLCPGAGTSLSVLPLADEFPGAQRNERSRSPAKRLAHLADRPFVLCVGTIEIRKNHLTLLEVWDDLAAELGEALPILVIAGRRGWKADETLRRLDHLPPGGRSVFIEAPADDELRWLYSACQFTVFPSFFEGWGLPVGEGFWFGKTCAASNTSSIPVVGRDLCRYFSPYEPEEIKAAVRDLIDPELRSSYEMKIAAAPLRSWADVGRDLKNMILQAARQPKAKAAAVSISEGDAA